MAKKSNVYKDKKTGLWYYKASIGTDPMTGKRRTKTKRGFKTENDAWKAYMMFMIQWEDNKENGTTRKEENITFGEFRDTIFLPWYKSQVKPNTYALRDVLLKKKFQIFDKKKIRDITMLEIQMFQNQLVSEGFTGGYVNMLLSLGGMVVDRAKIFEFVEENPFREIGRVRNEPKKIRFWTLENFRKFERCIFSESIKKKVERQEFLSLTEYYHFFYYVYFRFLFFSGLRFGESATLLWENINLKTGKIKVLYTIGNVFKAKSEQYFSTPKSKSSVRELYLDSKTVEFLLLWKKYQEKTGNIELVFSHDDTFLNQGSMWNKFKVLQEVYELPRISIHDLRHSHASLLIHLGESPKMVQKRLGHSKIEMTLGTYSHLYPNEELGLVSRLESII